MRLLILLGSVLLNTILFSCQPNASRPKQEEHKQALQQLSGTYQDATPYPYGDAFGKRVFTFDRGHWTLHFTLGLDPQLQQPVFEFRTYGTYEVLAPSTVVDQAYNAIFWEEKKFLTLKTDQQQLVTAFGLEACGLSKDVEKDISGAGCAAWPSVAQCPKDHDLLALDEAGLLYFGVRPTDNNLCTADRRPTALTPGVEKQ